jgi:hypothetical protein
MTEVDALRRELFAAQTELAQLRRMERIADSDLVRLSLAAWAALVDDHPAAAEIFADMPAVISNQSSATMRAMARTNLRGARCAGRMAERFASKTPALESKYRMDALVRRLKATMLLAAAKEKR